MLSNLRSALRIQEGGLLLVIVALGAVLAAFSGKVRLPLFTVGADGARERVFVTEGNGERVPATVEKNKFLNAQNLAQLAKDTSFIAIMAVGMAIVIIAGGIDLSVGSIYALASVLGAMTLHHFGPEAGSSLSPGVAVLLGGVVCVGAASLCGFLNGALVVALGVHPFIITLGTMAILRGVAFVLTKGQSIGGFPEALRNVVRFELGNGLSVVPCAVMILVTIMGGIFLSRLAAGRRVYAVGGNEVAAKFSGIQVKRVKLGVYVLSGLTAGIAAFLSLGYYGSATSGDGQGYELNVIAAAVVGGASLAGGKGTALGALLGALIIQMISSGIVTLGIDQNYSQIIIGTFVIAAVVFENYHSWVARWRAARNARSRPTS
jgi:ribose/xylose/arabinose/galactoside ABC-type transport system permease subunit